MKNTILFIISFFLLTSCGGDKDGPSIQLNNESSIVNGDNLDLSLQISDASLVSNYTLEIVDSEQTLFTIISTPNTNDVHRLESIFISTNDESIRINVEAEDEHGNTSSKSSVISVEARYKGSLELNFKLSYGEDPLIMYEPITYLTGEKITFTRISTYLSELKLDDTLVDDIAFLRLDDAHLDLETAKSGYKHNVSAPLGNFERLSFSYGLSQSQNEKRSSDYPSGHPLANSGEYWVGWNSFVFVKIEGRIDTNNDGQLNEGFALHLGGNEARRSIEISESISTSESSTPIIEFEIDLKKVLGGDSTPYDLINNGRLHSLSHLPYIILLADNLQLNTNH